MISSSLEPVLSWEEKKIGVKVTHTVQAPYIPTESSPPPQPSLSLSPSSTSSDSRSSEDIFSADICSPLASPRYLPLFHSQRLLACGGPGFSLAVIDCETGATDQLSVPFPRDQLELAPEDLTDFTFHNITSISVVGERQLWAGTSSGTLHIFELTESLRLQKHSLIKINEPILCIASRPMECVFPSEAPLTSLGPQTEVLLGIPHGYIVILEGRADLQGRLQDVLRLPRKVIRFTDSSTNCAVNCIVHVSEGSETYWCSCGSTIVVLARHNWQKLQQINARPSLPPSSPSHPEVRHLVASESGIWSCISQSSTITLWDKTNYSAKLHITVR